MTVHQNLTVALGQAGYLGLVAVGLAFSLRTGSPNLAVGSIMAFSTMMAAYLITEHNWGTVPAFIVAILLATLLGFVLGVLVAVFSVPAWAATFGAAGAIQAITLTFTKAPVIPVHIGGSYPTALWYGLFALVSAGGGALWLLPGVRRALSGARSAGDPARWAGLRPGLGTIVGLTGSSFLAGLASVPALTRFQAAETVSGTGATVTALAAVLLGGVSVFGRRAGVFGTLLAVTILTVIQTLITYNAGPIWLPTLIVGLVALAGLGVSRGLESMADMLNRPRPAPYASPPALPPAR
jgi:ribose/xylose/arabinose/galactoside ABC-type transport system permease subunit